MTVNVAVERGTLVADGIEQTRLTVTPADGFGNPISGVSPEITTNLGTISGLTEEAPGTFGAVLTAGIEVGLATVEATIDNTSGSATVDVTTGPPAQVNLGTDRTEVDPDGRTTVGFTAVVRDAQERPILDVDPAALQLLVDNLPSSVSFTNNLDGTYSGAFALEATEDSVTLAVQVSGLSSDTLEITPIIVRTPTTPEEPLVAEKEIPGVGTVQISIPSANLPESGPPRISIDAVDVQAVAEQLAAELGVTVDVARVVGGVVLDLEVESAEGEPITTFDPPLKFSFPYSPDQPPVPDVILLEDPNSPNGFRPLPTEAGVDEAGRPVLMAFISHTSFIAAGVNSVPVANPAEVSLEEDDSVEITLNGSDENDDLLTFTITSLPGDGTLLDGDQTVSSAPFVPSSTVLNYTPAENYFGPDSFQFKVNDGAVDSDEEGTIGISVAPVNDIPVAVGDTYSVNEDGSLTRNVTAGVLANDSDVEDELLTVTLVDDVSNGTLSLSADGGFTYNPNLDFFGSDTFSYIAADDEGEGSETVTVTLEVDAVNDAPTINPIADLEPILDIDGEQTVQFSGVTIGAANEAQVLTVTAASSNTSVIADPVVEYTSPAETGILRFTPVPHGLDTPEGTIAITVTVQDDGDGQNTASETFNVTVIRTNQPPSVTPPPPVTIDEDTPGAIALEGTDADSEDVLTAIIATLPTNGSLHQTDDGITPGPEINAPNTEVTDAARRVIYIPAENAHGEAFDTFGFIVTDGKDNSGEATVTVNVAPVNDPPTIDPIPDQPPISEEAGDQTVPLSGISAGPPDEIQTLAIAATSNNPVLVSEVTVTYTSPESTGTLVYRPEPNANGTATITVTVTDDGEVNNTASTSFSVTISPVEDAPTISDILDQTTAEDTSTEEISFTIGDVDTPATDLTVTGSSSDQTLVPDANITLGDTDASRSIQVTPAANQSGSTTITVSVSDGTDTASDTFVLTVTAVNDPPTISDIQDQTTAEDTPTAAISFTVNDVDTAVGDLTVAGSSSNQTLLPDANIVPGGTEANRTVQITPAANQSGEVTITVAVSDGTDTASTSFALTVTPVNDPPTISNISDQTANQNTPTGAISFTVGDAETAAGSLTVTSSSSNQTLVPDANINVGGTGANRTVQVTPAANQSGSTTITIRVSDAAVAATDTFVLTVSDTTFAIASTDPQGGGVNFAVNGEIQVDFGEPLNPATAANSISVQGARPYTGQVRIENNLLIFRSNEIFGDEESIQITVTTTVQDAAGNALGQDFTFSVTTGFGVWPGDTNNDARVNLLDIIPIARFFNQPSGIARLEPRATAWAVQPVPPWPAKPATYADANGDGLINADDITPVADNWL